MACAARRILSSAGMVTPLGVRNWPTAAFRVHSAIPKQAKEPEPPG